MAAHVQLMIEGARKAGAELATVAYHLHQVSYLTPGEGEDLTLALAHVVAQAERALSRVDDDRIEPGVNTALQCVGIGCFPLIQAVFR